MRIGPLFKWFGSKWQSAKRYPEPKHVHIVEPYAGGAGYSLNYADRAVTIYDADPNLAQLWRWLIDDATDLDVREIPLNTPTGVDIRTLGLSTGQALLLKHWQRTNNVGDCWTVSPWGSLPGQWTANTRARVAEEISAIKHWRFEPLLSVHCIATWFIDPPYLFNYRYRKDLPPFDHAALVRFVGSLPLEAQVIVCEAQCKKTRALPAYLPFVQSHSSVTSRRHPTHSHHSSELIYTRG